MSQFDSGSALGADRSDPRPAPRDDAVAAGAPDGLAPEGLTPSVAASGGSGASLVGIIGAAILLGLAVFLWMSSHRPPPPSDLRSPASPSTTAAAPTEIPPDIIAMEAASRAPSPGPTPVAESEPPPLPPPLPTYPAPKPTATTVVPSPHSPVLVVDLADSAGTAPATTGAASKEGTASSGRPTPAGASGLTADEQFASRVEAGSEPDHARATVLRNKGSVVAQGAMIPAVLETALDSDLPGFARAVVSRDVRSFDGLAVLIPRGSRVIGEYRPATAEGQTRAFVIWTRVLRPDGVSIQIGSPATDPLGRAGLSGSVDNHFFQRFSGAILLTVVNAGAYALAGTPSTEVVVGSSSGTAGVAGAASAFAPANIAPTIRVPQGAPIRIFVARDLEFAVPGAP